MSCDKPTGANGTLNPGKDLILSDREQKLFDSYAQETTKISGTDCEYYSLDIACSTVDPLYDEAVKRVFKGPYLVKGFLRFPKQRVMVAPDGATVLWDSELWLARLDMEKVLSPPPQPGDVVRFWNTRFFNFDAAFEEKVPKSGMYFNVINVNTDGHLFDNPTFVGFKLDLKRNTSFTPERRVTNT